MPGVMRWKIDDGLGERINSHSLCVEDFDFNCDAAVEMFRIVFDVTHDVADGIIGLFLEGKGMNLQIVERLGSIDDNFRLRDRCVPYGAVDVLIRICGATFGLDEMADAEHSCDNCTDDDDHNNGRADQSSTFLFSPSLAQGTIDVRGPQCTSTSRASPNGSFFSFTRLRLGNGWWTGWSDDSRSVGSR